MKLSYFFKTGIFFAALTALLILLGYFISGTIGAIIFLIIALVTNLGMYWFSDKIALRMAGAQELDPALYPTIVEDVTVLSKKMGIPMPRLYMSPELQPNAFATGRNPKNSAVCLTEGIVKVLNRRELEGVIAHELAHIKNRDTLIATLAAVLAGVISSISQIGMFFSSGSDEERNPITDLLMVIAAPVVAMIVQLAISRSREYLADATAASYTGDPEALALALQKIEHYATQVPLNVNPAMSSLYISNPFSGGGLMELFSTHPRTEKRISRLAGMVFRGAL
jgi:heat shock protein HtpX